MLCSSYLFKRDHLGTSHQGSGSSVLDRLVGDGELAQVETDKVGLDLNIDELLSVVNTNDGADHLGEDDSVTQVGSDSNGLLAIRALLLGLGELLDEGHRASLDASGELSSLSGVEHSHDVGSGHIQQLIELNTSEGELSEGARLLLLSKIGTVLEFRHLVNETTEGRGMVCFTRNEVCHRSQSRIIDAIMSRLGVKKITSINPQKFRTFFFWSSGSYMI